MAGISYKAGKPNYYENKRNKFQNQELNNDFGLGVYEFKYRVDDPQIGRFWQIDPLADKYVHNSTYAFSENKVIAHVELEGLESMDFRTQRNEENYLSGKITEQQYRDNIRGSAIGGVIGAGIVLSCMFPNIAGPIVAAEVFGVPSPTAPTSVAATAASEGKALTQIEVNAAKGKDFEQAIGASLQKEGKVNISEQITIKADNGVKTRVDFASKDLNGNVVLTEAKSSQTAPLTKNQKLAFPSIEKSGGTVVGKGKPDFPGGTKIPPTKIYVIRPKFPIE